MIEAALDKGLMEDLLLWREFTFQYTQVVIASLVLPLMFIRQFLAIPADKPAIRYINVWFKLAWSLLVISIFLGFSHQLWVTEIITKSYKGTNVHSDYVHWLLRLFVFTAIMGIFSFSVGCLFGKNEQRLS